MTQRRSVASAILILALSSTGGILVDIGGSPLAAAEEQHAYFTELIRRSDHWKSYSFRDPAQVGSRWVTYNPAVDARPDKQDAAKIVIPAFRSTGFHLVEPVDRTATSLTLTNGYPFQRTRVLKIDSEVMAIVARSGNTVTVTRGAHGTAPSAHNAGTEALLATNSLPAQVRVPLGTEDGHDYLFVWDSFWTDSYMRAGRFNHKAFQFSSGGRDGDTIWLEPQVQYGVPGRCNSDAHVGLISVRFYNRPGGEDAWDSTDGNELGPSPIDRGSFCIEPNTWTRFFLLIRQKANDYDPVDMWVADERRDPVQMIANANVSVRPTGLTPNSIAKFWIEFNSSTDDLLRPDGRDLVSYVRNFVALRDVRDVPRLLVKPVSSAGPATVLQAPTRLRIVR